MRYPAPARRAAAAGALLVTLGVFSSASAVPAGAAEPAPVVYQPPVDAPVVDPFRPPRTLYGPGNRGIDYASTPGTPVRAAAPGVVAFAGPVASGLHVVILHADGIRSSYSFMRRVDVRRGQRVGSGDVVGTAGPILHFGARAGDAYLHPLVLLAASSDGRLRVHLVPDAERKLQSEEGERRGLRRLLGRVSSVAYRVGGGVMAWARQTPDAVVSMAGAIAAGVEDALVWIEALAPLGLTSWDMAVVAKTWWDRRHTCTREEVVPPPPDTRRIAVLVAGLGSSSGNAAIYDVKTDALGYAPGDVYRFSYRGGSTADNPYAPADTQEDIARSGRHLRDLVERIHAQHPGIPIDILAHSQGGIVTRSALGQRAPAGVEHVVTLGSPHQGADLATALDLNDMTAKGRGLQWLIGELEITGIDPQSTSVRQLSEASDFMRDLNSRPLPEGVRFTSVAARADVVVPSPRSRLAGATHAVVSVPSVNHHDALPGSDAATREIGLARAGMAPTCESLDDAVADHVAGHLIGTAEDAVGSALFFVSAR